MLYPISKTALKIGMISVGVMTFSFANAQNRGTYNGPRANVDTYSRSPDQDLTFCDRDPQARVSRETYQACAKAIAAAKRMAENCDQANGEIDGYRRGYSWAFYSSINYAQKDPQFYQSGIQSVSRDPNMGSYIQQKAQDANSRTYSEGTSRGSSQAVQRFIDFVDSGASRAGGVPSNALPNPIPVPAHGSPYQNPYQTLLPGQFQSLDQMIDQAQFEASQYAFMNRYDPIYWGGSRPDWRVRDLYLNDGVYAPRPSMCGDVNQAFDRWANNDRMGRGEYTSYRRSTTTQPAPQPQQPDPRSGGRGDQGAPNRGQTTAGGRPAPTPVPGNPAPAPTAAPQQPDLQDIYARAFRSAYPAYKNYYYSQGFYRNLDFGQFYGDTMGRQIGTQYAFQTGRRDSFNDQFISTEANVFRNLSSSGYEVGFNSKFHEYLTQPQPAFELVSVVGEIDDGIIQPNEKFSLAIRVKNYGAVAANYPAQVAGSVSEAKAFSLSAPALSSNVVSSGSVGRMAGSSGRNAQVVLQVAGRELPLSQYVTEQVTPTQITYDASIPNGIVKATVVVVNHSRVKSYDAVKVTLSDAFGHILSQNLGFLEAGQTMPVTFTISDYDPLTLVDGKVSLQSQTYLGGAMVGDQAVNVRSTNVNADIARTFDVAVASSALSYRVPALQARLYQEVLDEAVDARRTKYDNDPETMIATLVSVKQSHAQTSQSLAAYTVLANQLSPVVSQMKRATFGGKSVNQKYLLRKLDELKSR